MKNKPVLTIVAILLVIALVLILTNLKKPKTELIVANSVEDCKKILPAIEKYCEFSVEPQFQDENTLKETFNKFLPGAPIENLPLIEQNICSWTYSSSSTDVLNAFSNSTLLNQSEILGNLLTNQRASITISFFKNQSVTNNIFNNKKADNENRKEIDKEFIMQEFNSDYYETQEITSPRLNQSKKIEVASIYKKKDKALISITQIRELNQDPLCNLNKLKNWIESL